MASTRISDLAPEERPALSVTEFYSRVDRALRTAFAGDLWVSGEIRSLKVLPKGHCFIDLVDPTHARDSTAPTLNVKCWATQWRRVRTTLDQLGIELDTGMVVRVRGELQFYKPRGSVDFILAELDTDALLGRVAAERARLVKALLDEGLYDRNRRLPVPPLPLRIGLVASPGTEGYRDFLGRLEGSGMAFDVRVVPSQVQGRDAPRSITRALGTLQAAECDVLVLVRGGGSRSDLSTFDAEAVARAIATSDTPVWTGIGHTGDQSVADELANRSFITPTECGQELARRATEAWQSVMEAGDTAGRLARTAMGGVERHLSEGRTRLATGARMQLGRHGDSLVHRRRNVRSAAHNQLAGQASRLVQRGEATAAAARRVVEDADRAMVRRTTLLAALPSKRLELEERQAGQWRRLLGAFDYQRQLERGYSVTRGPDGSVLRSAAGVTAGTRLVTRLADGELTSIVEAVPAPSRPDRPNGEDPA